MTTRIAVAIEETSKKSFASAIDWPGWSRSGKTVAGALEALRAYADRYRIVARLAGVDFPSDDLELEVYETATGGTGTEFGVPSRVTDADRRPTTAAEAERLAALVEASWTRLAAIAKDSPEVLRKGPRGGGRDRTKLLGHVVEADSAYAREVGLASKPPAPDDERAVADLRASMLDVLRTPSDGSPIAGRKWTARYAAHRIAWHALDHAWEMEDRRDPAPG
ncbi:MAG TPA: hypothetical protein VFO50_00945 [Candidatus Limnocylindrales bacterium]|nr:hypothetical protein [Candidatus Limnocylindrales bacterium]